MPEGPGKLIERFQRQAMTHVNLLKRLFSSNKPLTPQQRANDLIKAIDAGGIPLNPAVVNDIARKMGLDVPATAPMHDTIERIRLVLKTVVHP